MEKKSPTQNFGFLSLKVSSPYQFLGSSTHADITEFSKFLLKLKNQKFSRKTVCGFSIIFILKGIMTF